MPSARYELGWARDGDWPAVGRLLHDAMPGPISLSVAREPDPRIAAAIEGDRHRVLVARERRRGRVVGTGSRSVREVWLDGRPVRVGYLGQLRRAPDLRFGPSLLPRAFAVLEETRGADELPVDLTSILENNRLARAVFERGWHRLPTYHRIARLSTLVLGTAPAARRAAGRRQPVAATAADLPAIVACLGRNLSRFQLAPVWRRRDLVCDRRTRGLAIDDFLVLRDGRRVSGCAAIWDQRGFKQIAVDGYAPWLRLLRRPLNLALALRSAPRLPPPGPLALAFLSHLAVDGDRPEAALALIDAARRRARRRGLDYLALGLTDRHPLLAPVRSYRRAVELGSLLYAVYRHPPPACVAALERGPVHTELAVL